MGPQGVARCSVFGASPKPQMTWFNWIIDESGKMAKGDRLTSANDMFCTLVTNRLNTFDQSCKNIILNFPIFLIYEKILFYTKIMEISNINFTTRGKTAT